MTRRKRGTFESGRRGDDSREVLFDVSNMQGIMNRRPVVAKTDISKTKEKYSRKSESADSRKDSCRKPTPAQAALSDRAATPSNSAMDAMTSVVEEQQQQQQILLNTSQQQVFICVSMSFCKHLCAY